MSSIFISYRRSDASGYAGRLYDRLSSHFGARHIFLDVDHIDPSDDFARTIDSRIHKADTVLVLIGPGWLDAADAQGRSRLHLETDYVRIEIATALRQEKTVIPVLLGRANMPTEGALPSDLQALAARQAFSCNDERFHADVDTLIEKIGRKANWRDKFWMGKTRASRAVDVVSRWSRRIVALAVFGGVSVAALIQIGGHVAPGNAKPARPYTAPAPRTRIERSYSSQDSSPSAGVDLLLRNRAVDSARKRQIVQQYNNTAKEIIDSMGR